MMNRNSLNLSYISQQATVILGNCSVVIKFICIAVLIGYALSFSPSVLTYLTVVPGSVLPPNFWIWTFLTHPFFETHIWCVIIDIGVIILYGKLLEPLWGALEMLIFFIIINVFVAVCSSFTYVIIYLVTKDAHYLFETHIHGLAGYIAGFSVAVKQIMPDNVLFKSPFTKLRNKHVPMLLFVLSVCFRLINGVDGPYPFMFGYGVLISWTYLRFYQKHKNGNRGDMADSFSFASFFPDQIRPVVSLLFNTLFEILIKLKVCQKPQRKYNMSSESTITVSLPGTDPLDAERRRTLALKALNERLNKAEPLATWPALEDEQDSSNSSELLSIVTELDKNTDQPRLEVKLESSASSTSELANVNQEQIPSMSVEKN